MDAELEAALDAHRETERTRSRVARGAAGVDSLSATAPLTNGPAIVAVDPWREAAAELRPRLAAALAGAESLSSFWAFACEAEGAIEMHAPESDVALLAAVQDAIWTYKDDLDGAALVAALRTAQATGGTA